MTCLLVFPCVNFLLILCGVVLGVLCICGFLVWSGLRFLLYPPRVCLCCFVIRKYSQFAMVMITGECCHETLEEHDEEIDKINSKLKVVLFVCFIPAFVIYFVLVMAFLLLLIGWFSIASYVASLSCRFVVRSVS